MNKKTKQVGLIGWPIEHSLSPAMHNAAFAELGLDWTYNLFPTQPGDLGWLLKNLDAQNIVGANVTMPHKQTIMPYLDHISDDARIIGAVNTIHIQNGKLIGHNTDGIGFLNALKEAGHEPAGMQVALLGAGGTARSVIFSLAQAGADRITVVNRTAEHGVRLIDDIASVFPACYMEFEPLSFETLSHSSKNIDLIVNATSVGMLPDDGASLWPDDLAIPTDTIFYDVIYKPTQTLFLQQAQAAGQKTINGLGMLVHQGVVAFEIWTGQKAPLETMKQACLKELGFDH
jgi:shikimate dehydrogenase